MKYILHKVHADISDGLEAILDKKLQKLDRFKNYITALDIYIKNLNAHNNDFTKEIEIKALVPGNVLMAQGRAATFEEAIDKAISSLKKQLIKYKDTR
ncbi:MAG: ribosome-associated translation inhibitor RaiA [Chlorobi bacterium]|nr:ribosome-associated translation inhibitor RaiA [Chlorobiota bacterium]